MKHYIDKSAVVAEIERRGNICEEVALDLRTEENKDYYQGKAVAYKEALDLLNTLEVKNPYEQCIQYNSVKAGIQAHAETYSFNIESELFNQLTKEQQKLWRKEIEQAVISGGEVGVELAKDLRYKENLEVKEVNLEKEIANQYESNYEDHLTYEEFADIAKHFFELGLSVSNSTKVTTPDIEDVLKENGVNPYSKEAKIIKESYYMALEKLKAQKGEEV